MENEEYKKQKKKRKQNKLRYILTSVFIILALSIVVLGEVIFVEGSEGITTTRTEFEETTCVGLDCSYTNYGNKVFDEINGEMKSLTEVSNVRWESGGFNFSYNSNYWFLLKPFVIYNGNVKTLPEIKQAFPNVVITDFVKPQKFNHKFALNFSNVPQNLVDNVDWIGFQLADSNGLTWNDIKKTGNHTISIKNKVEVNYGDLLASGYTLNLVNKSILLIGNISANYENGVIALDPSIRFDTTDTLQNVQLCDGTFGCFQTGNNGIQFKWDLETFCNLGASSIEGANMSLYFNNFHDAPDNDSNVRLILDQGWTEATSAGTFNSQSFQNVTTSVFAPFTASAYNNISILTQMRSACSIGNNFTVRLYDPDNSLGTINNIRTSSLSLWFGHHAIFGTYDEISIAPRLFSGKEPILYIEYTAGNSFENITLLEPLDNTISTNVTYDFSCDVEDADGVSNVSVWGNWSGVWHRSQTNFSGLKNNNFTIDLNKDFQDQADGFDITGSGMTAPRGITTNNSDFWLVDISDDFVYHFSADGTNLTDGFSTTSSGNANPLGITNNGSDFWITDTSDDFLYHYSLDGTNLTGGFDIGIAGMGNPNELVTNGSDFWIIDATDDFLYHFDAVGNNITDGFGLASSGNANPSGVTYNGSDFWVIDQSDMMIYHYDSSGNNLTDGFTVSLESGNSVGLTSNKELDFGLMTDIYFQDVIDTFTYHMATASSGTHRWNCEACDDLGACAFNETDYLLTVGEPGLDISHVLPKNMTYVNGDGLTNFTCNYSSGTGITDAWITLEKHYGGWWINETYNISQMDIDPITKNLTARIDLTNGWYSWNCNATNAGNDFNETLNNWRYQTGNGSVYIQQAMHTEPRGVVYDEFNQALNMVDFQEGGNIDSAFVEVDRYKYNDSFGNPSTRVWKIRMDQPICESTTGCNSVVDEFLNDDWNYLSNPGIDGNISFWNDSVGLHIHWAEWMNWTRFNAGECGSGGIDCQPAKYYNQILTANGTIYREESDIEMANKILAYFIVDSEVYPRSSVVGWLGVTNDISNWYSEKVPFMYDNLYGLVGTGTTSPSQPLSNAFDWREAPHEMYNPSPTDYQMTGNNSNYIIPCTQGGMNDNFVQWNRLNYSFYIASKGLDNIVCHYTHTYSTGNIVNDVAAVHKCLNSTIWGICSAGGIRDDMATLYPQTKYIYTTGKDMVQKVLGKTDTTDPVITLTISDDEAIVNSNEPLWNTPLLGIKLTDGTYLLADLNETGNENEWNVTITKSDISSMRVGALDESFNEGYSTLLNNNLNITNPLNSTPVAVTLPQNLTITFEPTCLGACPITGIQFTNATVGDTLADNTSAPTFNGDGTWEVNISLPEGNGLLDLTLTVQHPDSGNITDTETSVLQYSCWNYDNPSRFLSIPIGCLFDGSLLNTLFGI